MADQGTTGIGERASAYAALVRLPNLFTAPPDVVLGAALAAGIGGFVAPLPVAGLGVASALLYAAGTTFNDYFDAAEDARDRPERPIPSGAVPRARAAALGAALVVAGVGGAWAAAGPVAGTVAGALAAVVLLYDGVFNGTSLGPAFMGASRGLNVALGATAATGIAVSRPPVAAVAVLVAVYIAGVTWMAEGETGDADARAVLVGVGAVAIAALGPVGVLLVRSPSALETGLTLVLLAGFVWWTGRALRTAYADPRPETIGPAVGACVLGLTALDAAFAATVGPVWAVATLVFVLPAVALSRAFDVT